MLNWVGSAHPVFLSSSFTANSSESLSQRTVTLCSAVKAFPRGRAVHSTPTAPGLGKLIPLESTPIPFLLSLRFNITCHSQE